LQWFFEHWRELAISILGSFGAIFLALESYEVLTDSNVKISFFCFIILGICPGIIAFLIDGVYISGFLKREVVISEATAQTKIRVKLGDIFNEKGWIAIATSDFFDSIVDENLISSKSLHGYVLNKYWPDNRNNWQKQIDASLRSIEGVREKRSKGNTIRYPIGTVARARSDGHRFLFVALGRTNLSDNVTSASAESLICAVRGLLREARAACSMEPLIIPLMGSGLARVGIKYSVLVDLIIVAIQEEARLGLITREILVVLPNEKSYQINLKNYSRNWKHGK
jgi:hypothetical protein